MINPCKPEIGKISKQILSRIVDQLRAKTKFNHWKNSNSDEVIDWFVNLDEKEKLSFVIFDIKEYYPSITETLLSDAIDWAQTLVKITPEEKDIIFKAKRSLLYFEGQPWVKNKGKEKFNVTMGSFDGAETSDLCGLFLLSKIQHLGFNIGLYRDDGLGVSKFNPRQTDMKKDQLCKIFKHKYNLTVLVEVNHTQVNFLDISLNLQTGIFKPYMKPNNHVMYVHADSNHPPAVKKNLPQNINNRLSRISANEEVFNEAAPTYQQALAASGYNHQLKFQPNIRSINRNKRNRNRKVIWFNPPWSSNVKSNVGALFLRILSECFPKGHVLNKAFNRNNVKVSYRTVDNVQKIVSRHNLRIINSQQPTPPPTTCRCHYPKSPLCPILCQAKNLVYRCRVTNPNNNNVSTYTGLTSQTLMLGQTYI